MEKKQKNKKVSVKKETNKNEIIPKYVLEGNLNIPFCLKKTLEYFRDCGNKKYQLCLVGKGDSVVKDLKNNNFQGNYPFIHLGSKELESIYSFLPEKVKKEIKNINKLMSNPENDFNKTNLGLHTLGLISIPAIKPLNDFGCGTTFWNGLRVFYDPLTVTE